MREGLSILFIFSTCGFAGAFRPIFRLRQKAGLQICWNRRFYLHLWIVVPFLPLEAAVVWTVVVETLCFAAVVMFGGEAAWYYVAVFGMVGVPTKLIFAGTAENMFSLSVGKLKLQNTVTCWLCSNVIGKKFIMS